MTSKFMPGGNAAALISLELLLDRLDDDGGAPAGEWLQDDSRRGMPVDVRVNIEELGTQLHLANVLEPQDLAIGICL